MPPHLDWRCGLECWHLVPVLRSIGPGSPDLDVAAFRQAAVKKAGIAHPCSLHGLGCYTRGAMFVSVGHGSSISPYCVMVFSFVGLTLSFLQ